MLYYQSMNGPNPKKLMKTIAGLPRGYARFLADLKGRIRSAQIKASLAVNAELVLLYWDIGREILGRQKNTGWGAKVIDRLASDLTKGFPGTKGFSARNLKYMRALAEAYPEKSIVQQAAAQIPWWHNVVIIEKVKCHSERLWYIQKTIENGWSRAVLWHQIESKLYERQKGTRKLTNFCRTLPPPQSDLANKVLKDPYNFDFLDLKEAALEKDLEKGLLEHIRSFLLELGKGFAFVGSQYPLKVDGEELYLDLLFYHLKLRSFIVIDLKMTEFKPEFAGKMNFYLSAMDDLLRHPEDRPTIGIILCKGRNKVLVEYALHDSRKPIGVSSYKLTHALPKQLKGSLPTIQELETELKSGIGNAAK